MPFEYWPGTNDTYACGWTKDMLYLPVVAPPGIPQTLAPQMIRITIQVVDPDGRVRDGMTRQFVFPVKRV